MQQWYLGEEMKIYFLRHGEADYDLEEKPGEFPGVPLTDKGKVQALNTAEELKNVKFDEIFCSDMLRTKQTIAPLTTHLSKEIIYEPRIREISGAVTGLFDENWFEESATDQMKRLDSFLDVLKLLKGNTILVVCHFSAIEYITEKLGNKVIAPECASIHTLEVEG